MPHSTAQIVKQYEIVKGERGNWETHWSAVAKYVLPTREFNTTTTAGSEKHTHIYNSVAPDANIQLSAAFEGMLFNTGIRWFELATDDERLNNDDQIRQYLYDSTNIILAYLDNPATGFAVAAHETAQELTAFGTGIFSTTESDGMLKYQARSLDSICLDTDDAGHVVDVYRLFTMPLWELVQEFGLEHLSDKTKEMAEEPANSRKQIKVLHLIHKRNNFDPERRDAKNKPWASYYIEYAEKHELRESGFDENPFVTPRWSVAPEEVYGRSPAMEALPAIRTVNAMSRIILEAGELAIRPPMVVHAGTLEGNIRSTAGGITYVRQGTRDIPAPLNTGARPDIGHELVAREEAKIEKIFFADRLRLPEQDRMTATEIIERRKQGLMVLSPVLSRLYAEWLNPVIQRTYNWLDKHGRLPQKPDGLAGAGFKPNYISPLAVTRRSAMSDGFLQAMSTAQLLIQSDPSVMQNLDSDGILRSLLTQNNVDPAFLRPKGEVAKMRKQQAEQQQQQSQLAQIEQAAGAAKDLGAAAGDIGGIGS